MSIVGIDRLTFEFLFIYKCCHGKRKDPLDQGNTPPVWQIFRLVVILGGLCEGEVDVDLIEELLLRLVVILGGLCKYERGGRGLTVPNQPIRPNALAIEDKWVI